MPSSAPRRLALAAAIAALALGLAACKKDAAQTAVTSGAPIAKVAAPAGKAWSEVVTVTPEGGYLVGNPQAPIKLVEFGALSCSHCAEFSEKASGELKANFIASGRVSYELRLMLNNALDMPAAMLATCGSPDAVVPLADQFWAWQKTMFDTIKAAGEDRLNAVGQLPRQQQPAAMAAVTGMDQFFAARGIAKEQGAACLADTAKAERLAKAASDYAATYQIEGTPTFYVNGSKLDINTWETLKPRLEQMGAR